MSKILATVGTLTVTDDEVNEFIYSLGQRGQAYNNPEGRRAVLNQLVSTKLLLLDAKRNLLEAEPEFKAQLAAVKDKLLSNYAGEKVLRGVSVSDKEARDYYDANADKFVSEESVNASHILVDTEERALELLAKIKAGEISFEDCARENSSCPSKAEGGSLGDFGKGQMVPEFDSAVFAMEVGDISEPVKTQFGYHIIKLNGKKAAEPMKYEEIAGELKETLLLEKRQKAYESKINQLKILYPVDMTV
ncbi:MAG: peptidylprolyl isomerase [Clostridia bacterium]|nr:peptidylprolyl isomerase [Clostridia bacterium]